VTDVTGTVEDGFTVSLDTATPRTPHRGAQTPALAEAPTTVRARRIVLASGAVDTLPPISGLLERWGKDVIHCPYCHGYEVRGQRIGVLATSSMWLHQAKLIR